MTQVFQKFTKRHVTGKGVLIALAVVSSILFSSGCMSSSPRTPTTTPDMSAPTSAITSPTTGATISAGVATTITGTASDTGGGSVARVEVSVDGGATFSAATGTTAWSFAFTPLTPGQATIISRATDTSGNVQNPTTQITVNVVLGGTWTAQGPGPSLGGGTEKVTPNNEVVGAIHAVAAHPTDANILYVGGVNSGIWRTGNATATRPNWTPLTDSFPSLSTGALEFDPTDATRRTLVAGIGRFSSFGRSGGPLRGLLRTTDGGDNWAQINHSLLVNQNISGVAARGATLLASANAQSNSGGLFRSTDGGINWVTVSGTGGLPTGGVFDLVGAPDNLNRFYVSVQRTGIFRSDDGGANWINISSGDPTLNGAITNAQNANAEMAVSSNGRRLYVIIANGSPGVMGARAQYIGFTDNPAGAAPAWTAMDLPQTTESNGVTVGLHPGGQASIHLSIAVDRDDPNTVYVAGDRQETGTTPPFTTPNFIGARNFSGRLFRGDTNVAPTGQIPSPQWEHLTHSNSIAQIPGGGTANGSSPHADSREMAIAANGDLIEVDDGGIYRRTSPQNNTGDWFSINGSIQTTEFHDIAYDTNTNTLIVGGSQDNGTSVQTANGSITWRLIGGGDGGDVAVDNVTNAASNQSIRYLSSQNLGGFRREVYDANNNLISQTLLASIPEADRQFVTPVELNTIDPRRLVIGGLNSVYESFNQGTAITEIDGPGANRNAMAYGAADNPDVLYVGSGSAVFLRATAGAALTQTAALPTGAATVRDVVMDPNDSRSAFAVDNNQVFRTTNAGASWTDITGNLLGLGPVEFNTTVFVARAPNNPGDMLLVGTNAGVFVAFRSSGFTTWNKLGIGLPNAPVADLDYDVADDMLVAGTLGRGAWTITNLRGLAPPPAQP